MIKILFTLIFFSCSVWAQSWPESMYTTEKMFEEQFSGLRTYISNLKVKYAYKQINNKLVFYKTANQILEERFKLIVKRSRSKDYIKEIVIFESFQGEKERFVFERWGSDLNELSVSKLTSFTFSIPSNVNAFRVEFQKSKIYQFVEYNETGVKSQYKLYDYGLKIYHFERKQKNRLYSKLWFQCDICSGEPLIAIMDTRNTYYGNMYYYFGNPTKNVTPKEFYTKANKSYLSGIFREFKSLPLVGSAQFGWPFN